MTLSHETETDVAARLRRLRTLNRRARKKGAAAAREWYNERVYRMALRCHRSPERRQIAKAIGLKGDRDDVAAWIDAVLRQTSRDDRRLRCKHGRALKHMALLGTRPSRVIGDLKACGGYNACGDLWAEWLRCVAAAP